MRGGIKWGLSSWAKEMVGWRDLNNNNQDDIVDQAPLFNLASNPSDQSVNPGTSQFSGQASVRVLARQGNPNGNGLTVDTIAKVEYRVGSTTQWIEAHPADGVFDSAEETFQVIVDVSSLSGVQNVEAQDVDIRITTFMSLANADTSTSAGGGGPIPTSLDNAHAFPNPFKPNSSVNHVNVMFTGLTPGSKVQIFTSAGDPVFERTAAISATTLQWDAINDSGSKVSSGVYFYFITDDAGHRKKGKIAVVR